MIPRLSRNNLTRKKLPGFIASLDSEKYSLMKDFLTMYKNAFGEPARESWVYRNLVIFTLMRIWIKNRDKFDESTFIKVFRDVESEPSVRQDSIVTSILMIETMTRKIYRIINKNRSINFFEKFWDGE